MMAADKQGAMASPSGATKLRGANVSDEENQGRRFSILMTTTVKLEKKKSAPRSVRFGPTEYADHQSTVEPQSEVVQSQNVVKKARLLHRTPTGRYHGRAPPRLNPNAAGAAPEASAEDTTEPEAIHVDLVSQELQPHHIGPMYRVEATFSRAPDEAMGMSILSGAIESQRGSRIGVIQPGSASTKCISGCVLVDDRIVEICGVDICEYHHEDVIGLLRNTTGTVTLALERSTQFMPKIINSPFVVQHGTSAIPSKRKLAKKKPDRKDKSHKKSFFSKDKKGSTRSGRDQPMTLKRAVVILVHRHPNSNGLQIGIRGGVEDGSFPKILTAVHPRSPFAPLVEGGELGNEYELLEINGNIALGMPHDDLISTLKDVGEEVQLRVIAPAMRNRQLAKLFVNVAEDEETLMFMGRLRRAMYTRLISVSTEPKGVDGSSLPGVTHLSDAEFTSLAAAEKLLEWVLHTNGYFYGLLKDSRGRLAAAAPFTLAPALNELYPLPPAPERLASPVRRLKAESHPEPTTTFETVDTDAELDSIANPVEPVVVSAPAPAPLPAGPPPKSASVVAIDASAESSTMETIVLKMQETTDSLKAKMAVRQASGEGSPSASDPDLAQAVASLQALHLSCAQALSDGEDTPPESAADTSKFVFKAESPSLKKRQVPRDTGRRASRNPAEADTAGPQKRSRTSQDTVVTSNGTTDVAVEGLDIHELLALVENCAQAIVASADTPDATQHGHAILSAVAAGKALVNDSPNGSVSPPHGSVSPSRSAFQDRSPNVLEIINVCEDQPGRDSGLTSDGESSDTTVSPSLEAYREQARQRSTVV